MPVSEAPALRVATRRQQTTQYIAMLRESLAKAQASGHVLRGEFWEHRAPAIAAMDPAAADPDEVERIAGNNLWTIVTCSACGRIVDAAVAVGHDADDDKEPAAMVCADCLRAALALLEPPDDAAPR